MAGRATLFAVVALALCAVAIAAPLSSSERLEKLNAMARRSSGSINFNSNDFENLIEGHRNFSVIVQLTALNRACSTCRTFNSGFEAVANSWAAVAEPNRLYFVTLDYDHGAEIFNKFKLTTAPNVYHYPPTQGKLSKPEFQADTNKFERYDVSRQGTDAEDFVRFVEAIVGKEVPVTKPFDFTKLITLVPFLVVIALAYHFSSYVIAILRIYQIWAVTALVFTYTMISGTMWNSIRGAASSGNREIFSPQFQQQYVIETNIVSMLYGTAGIFFLLMIVHLPTLSGSKQRIAAYAYSVAFFLFCSIILFVFRFKYSSYPFRLLF